MEGYIKKLKNLQERVWQVKETLNVESQKKRLQELNFLIGQADFWTNNSEAVQISQEAENLKSDIGCFEELEEGIRASEDLALLAKEYQDESVNKELEDRLEELENSFSQLEFLLLFSGENDNRPAILSIHAGTGGVDAQDWAEMLERMYFRFAEKKGFQVELLDRVVGSEAGIKTSTFRVSGPYAYANFKGENGVHRLVRISPFDAEQMRHTSFVGVEVIPEAERSLNIELEDKDLKIDVYRSSGPGGQSVNTTDSAVRLTHLPTGISVTCQSERSQHQNRERALVVLKSKLYQQQEEKKSEEEKKIKGTAGQGTWGKQIRSYVFQPYQMVKDHRTNYSTSDIESVMNGNLDELVEAYLSFGLGKKDK